MVTAYDLQKVYLGLQEREGSEHHPLIQWWFELCGLARETPDEVAWCSAFCQHAPYELGLQRSHSAAARSWLKVGRPVAIEDALKGFDVVVLKRGKGPQPGPEVTSGAPGHVGYFAGLDGLNVLLLGGNQANRVSIAPFPIADILGVRRLIP